MRWCWQIFKNPLLHHPLQRNSFHSPEKMHLAQPPNWMVGLPDATSVTHMLQFHKSSWWQILFFPFRFLSWLHTCLPSLSSPRPVSDSISANQNLSVWPINLDWDHRCPVKFGIAGLKSCVQGRLYSLLHCTPLHLDPLFFVGIMYFCWNPLNYFYLELLAVWVSCLNNPVFPVSPACWWNCS